MMVKHFGGTLVYLEWAIIGWLERSSHCISTYKDVGTLEQVHADVSHALGMALRVVIPNLLHDGAEEGYVGDRVWDLLNFVEDLPGMRRVVPYTNSAMQQPRFSLTLLRRPRRTIGRASIH